MPTDYNIWKLGSISNFGHFQVYMTVFGAYIILIEIEFHRDLGVDSMTNKKVIRFGFDSHWKKKFRFDSHLHQKSINVS